MAPTITEACAGFLARHQSDSTVKERAAMHIAFHAGAAAEADQSKEQLVAWLEFFREHDPDDIVLEHQLENFALKS